VHAPPPLGPGSWGFEGPEVVGKGAHRGQSMTVKDLMRCICDAILSAAAVAEVPGSWGFQIPEAMQSSVVRNGRLFPKKKARCVGASNVGDCRAGTSSVGGAGVSSIKKIDGESSDITLFLSESG